MDDERPFDAAESYLCDAPEGTMARWRTSSLVTAVKGILERQPQFEHGSPSARLQAFRAAADELTRRGIDSSSLVRYGMWGQVASSIISPLVESLIVQADEPASTVQRADTDQWWNALELPPRPVYSEKPPMAEFIKLVEDVIAPAMPRILNWVSMASLEEMLTQTPPTGIVPSPSGENPFDDNLLAQYRWVVDHFSATFYSEWATISLHYAHRWLAGHETPACHADLMKDRQVNSIQLNAEM